ncbi:MAG: hypothetical protein KKE50_01870 [Nanoarchaeota archaeon]|nr:hypothetical protein [Nanoarchaeota archaeon]
MRNRIMRRNLNKRGVSEMIAYVLLIVIAISVSIIVYAYLKSYVWKDNEGCPDGVSLIIEDYICDPTSKTLTLTINNHGTHSVDGFMLHGSNSTRKGFAINLVGKENNGEVFFEGDRLNASESRSFIFTYTEHASVERIEIKPLRFGKNLIVCENSIITQDIGGCG